MLRRWLVLPLLLLVAAMPIVAARADGAWKVKNKLAGKIKDGEPRKAEDVSGIACIPAATFPRLCLVVDDESQGAQIVLLTEGMLVAGDFIPLIDAKHKGKPLELDAEGVAYADGFFYVIGSHGRARHEDDTEQEAKVEAKAAATRLVFRLGLSAENVDPDTGKLKGEPAITQSEALATVMQSDPVLAPFFNQPLEENGITVEGVAVKSDRIYVAFRGPVVDGQALIASAPLAEIFDGQAGKAELHRLALGEDSLGQPRGIRDLTVEGDGFLLIAGPEYDPPKKHAIAPDDYAVYSWDGNAASKLLDLPPVGKKAKPEALLPLDRNGARLRVLLMFDGPKEGAPTPLDITLP